MNLCSNQQILIHSVAALIKWYTSELNSSKFLLELFSNCQLKTLKNFLIKVLRKTVDHFLVKSSLPLLRCRDLIFREFSIRYVFFYHFSFKCLLSVLSIRHKSVIRCKHLMWLHHVDHFSGTLQGRLWYLQYFQLFCWSRGH